MRVGLHQPQIKAKEDNVIRGQHRETAPVVRPQCDRHLLKAPDDATEGACQRSKTMAVEAIEDVKARREVAHLKQSSIVEAIVKARQEVAHRIRLHLWWGTR